MLKVIAAGLIGLALVGCNRGSDGPTGPNEYLVVPRQPLQIPPVLTLPQPAPGARNLADPSPAEVALRADQRRRVLPPPF